MTKNLWKICAVHTIQVHQVSHQVVAPTHRRGVFADVASTTANGRMVQKEPARSRSMGYGQMNTIYYFYLVTTQLYNVGHLLTRILANAVSAFDFVLV